jgi:hypothetical protein
MRYLIEGLAVAVGLALSGGFSALAPQGRSAWQPSRLWRAMGFKPFAEATPIDGLVGDD